jgi:DNA-directed RNA polymerase subunit RPC12/RpoP
MLSSQYNTAIIIVIPALIVFMASVIYLTFGIRCPRCKGMMGHVISYGSGPFSISKKVNYCPYCGQDINKEAEKDQSKDKE